MVGWGERGLEPSTGRQAWLHFMAPLISVGAVEALSLTHAGGGLGDLRAATAP